jgi:hypothetical protein
MAVTSAAPRKIVSPLSVTHARWGGYAHERGIAVLAVFGNIITSLSWFGVNMLGVGLHSYGFMDQAFGVLLAFIISQLVIICMGIVPQKYWRGSSQQLLSRPKRCSLEVRRRSSDFL